MLSIDNKMGVLGIIDTLNANSNVTKLLINLSSNHKWNSEIRTIIMNRYTNVYHIYVVDINDSIDHQMHDWIKQYV